MLYGCQCNLTWIQWRSFSFFCPSIHPCIHLLLLIHGRGILAAALAEKLWLPCPQPLHPALLGGCRDIPRTDSLQNVLGLPRGLLPMGRAQNTSPGRHQGGILNRCPGRLIWLLSMRRSSGWSLSSSQMTKLLALSRGESLDILRIQDLVLSVTVNDHRWG